MGDTENALPPSKKRAAGRELSRENPGFDDEDSAEQETGTFKRASEEVLAGRRIVKVRRPPPTSTPSSNPFAGIRLVPPTEPSAPSSEVTAEAIAVSDKTVSEDGKNDVREETEKVKDGDMQSENKIDEPVAEPTAEKESAEGKEEKSIITEASKSEDNEAAAGGDKDESGDKKDESGDKKDESEDKKDEKDSCGEKADPSAEGTPLSSFQQLSSSQNAFQGLAGTGFSSSTFSFGSIPKDGSALGTTFGFGSSTNGNSSLFNKSGPSIVSKGEGSGFPSMQEVAVETGEENEKAVFFADSVLFEFLDGGWKERGKGELKVNVSTTGTEKARLVMRARGNYRLILNASLYPDMKLTNMDKKGITFACMNSTGEGKDGLSTFALKFKDSSIVEDFRAAVTAHKGKTATTLKTPENSPKASDD